jgi:hypothetical protein
MTAAAIAGILLSLGAELAQLAGVEYQAVMEELAKRTTVDTSASDAAAARMDAKLPDEG